MLLRLKYSERTHLNSRQHFAFSVSARDMFYVFYVQAVVRHIHAKDLKVAPIFSPEPKHVPKEDTKPNNTTTAKSSAKAEKSKQKDNGSQMWETVW